MLRLAADENFNGKIIRGLLRRNPAIDVVRVQDTKMYKADDRDLLAWTAAERRILLTHDVSTMGRSALERVENGLPMPGVFQCHQNAAIGEIIESLLVVVECSFDGEWEGQIRFLPL